MLTGQDRHEESTTPSQEGPYIVSINYTADEILQSPFKVSVLHT